MKNENSGSVIENIENDLIQKIVSGELQAGDKLPTERELADSMGVSRSSVHQAFAALEFQGLITVAPRDGVYVNDIRSNPTPQTLKMLMNYGSVELDHELFEDMMDIRIWLERECAKRACPKINVKSLIHMRALVDAMEKKNMDLGNIVYDFHFAIVKAAGNSIFCMIFSGFEDVIKALIRKHYTDQPEDILPSVETSRQLIKAFEDNNPELAQDLVQLLIDRGVKVLRRKYE